MALTGTLTFGDALNSGTLTVTGGAALQSEVTLVIASSAVLSGVMSGSYGFVKDGGAELTLSGTNTSLGVVTILDGTLSVSGGAALADGVDVVVENAGLMKVLASESISSIAGAGGFNLSAGTLTLSGSVNTAVSGVVSGAGALLKTGESIFTLTGSNTFSGGMSLNSGTIRIGNDVALGSGTFIFNGGALTVGVIDVNGDGDFSNDKLGDRLVGSVDRGVGLPSQVIFLSRPNRTTTAFVSGSGGTDPQSLTAGAGIGGRCILGCMGSSSSPRANGPRLVVTRASSACERHPVCVA
jgi:autotransporter-associated beta strand protein